MRGRFRSVFFSPKMLGGAFAGTMGLAVYGVQNDSYVRGVARKYVEKAAGNMPAFVNDAREMLLREWLFNRDGIEFVENNINGKKAVFLRGENHYDVDEAGYQAIIDDLMQNGRNPRVVRAGKTGPFFRKLRSGYFVVGTQKVEAGDTVLPYYTSGVVSVSYDQRIAGMFSCGTNPLGIMIIAVPKEFILPVSRNTRVNKYRAYEEKGDSHQLGEIIYNEHECASPRLRSKEILAVCVVDTSQPGFRVMRVHVNEAALQNHDQTLLLEEQALEFMADHLQTCEDAGAKKLFAYFQRQQQDPSISNKRRHNALAAENIAVAYSRALSDMARVYQKKYGTPSAHEPLLASILSSPASDGVVYGPVSRKSKSLDAFIEKALPSFMRTLRQAYSFRDRESKGYSENILRELLSSIDPDDLEKIHPMLLDVTMEDVLALKRQMKQMGISAATIDKLLGDSLKLYKEVHDSHGHLVAKAEHYHQERARELDRRQLADALSPQNVTSLKS